MTTTNEYEQRWNKLAQKVLKTLGEVEALVEELDKGKGEAEARAEKAEKALTLLANNYAHHLDVSEFKAGEYGTAEYWLEWSAQEAEKGGM